MYDYILPIFYFALNYHCNATQPDVVAPGVDILAAYSPIASPSDGPLENRQVQYNIVSGTSMACPHAAGAAAYVKSITLTAARPGLVYDADKEDYVKMLCGMGFDSNSLARITGDNSTCLDGSGKFMPLDFNYPAITFRVSPMAAFSFRFHRTVTNVGQSNSTYKAKLETNFNVTTRAQPTVLSFKSLHEKKSFVVTVEGQGIPDSNFITSSLVWSDGIHTVQSPIIVVSQNTDF
ncbi:peptidase, putative [Ricinus communis]|uniref:Peptidase, putative n=1 Tax=Ricinus communis TaxID=3988 RepID=B9S3B7_RICCO|nr:peptidase, putative [Ricinus communis]